MISDLERALNALSQRHEVIGNNVANLNTPGFTRSDLDFFSHMRSVFAGSGPAEVTAEEDLVTPVRLDGNNVSMEREMFALSQTTILYDATSRSTTQIMDRLRYAITEGRG